MVKTTVAKMLGWGQFALVCLIQASNGHVPQNKHEWAALGVSFLTALGVHLASNTDGIK